MQKKLREINGLEFCRTIQFSWRWRGRERGVVGLLLFLLLGAGGGGGSAECLLINTYHFLNEKVHHLMFRSYLFPSLFLIRLRPQTQTSHSNGVDRVVTTAAVTLAHNQVHRPPSTQVSLWCTPAAAHRLLAPSTALGLR